MSAADHSGRDTEVTPGLGARTTKLQFAAGDIIDGKYQVDRIIGEGGMGMVLAATHLHLRQRVALKFMRPEAMDIPEAAARFSREARAAARLRGEHVCRVLDMGQIPGGAPYIVIEHLEGEDLSTMLRRRGRFSGPDAVGLVLQVADAMAEAHAAGIIHRDLKPANLFVTMRADGTPWLKVLDFGISKLVGQDTSSDLVDTRSSALIGSPLYMAPEQLLSAREVDARADIWALGVILFQLVAGRTPVVSDSLPETVAKVLHDDAPRLAQVMPEVSQKLDEAVARCLSRDREERPATVAALASSLASLAPSWALHLPGRIAAAVGEAPAAVAVAGGRRVSWPRIGLAVVALAAVVISLTLWLSDGGEPDATGPGAEHSLGDTEPTEVGVGAPGPDFEPTEVGVEAPGPDFEPTEIAAPSPVEMIELDAAPEKPAPSRERPARKRSRRRRRPPREAERVPGREKSPAPDADEPLPTLLAPSEQSPEKTADPDDIPDILAPE